MTTLDDVTRGLSWPLRMQTPLDAVLDTSGYSHRVAEADVYDSHDYTQGPG